MDTDACVAAASSIIDPHYVALGGVELRRREEETTLLLQQKCLPARPWTDPAIKYLLSQLAMMDSNNSSTGVGAGEREGRVYSRLVAERNYSFSHGIGRSGDITAVQPKAAGSSLMYSLTNCMTLHAIRVCGIQRAEKAVVFPTATGMTLALVLSALKNASNTAVFDHTKYNPLSATSGVSARRSKQGVKAVGADGTPPRVPHVPGESPGYSGETAVDAAVCAPAEGCRQARHDSRRYVIWSRIDQKSCFKSIIAAGCEPVVIDLVRAPTKGDATGEEAVKTGIDEGDELVTNVTAIADAIERLGAENIVAVMTITSCFAPRSMDAVVEVAKLCRQTGVPHVINNAYGLQSSKICHEINEAIRVGRVDAFVQSCDKNFMVPVGGAIVASPCPTFVCAVAELYPGRASVAPIMDLFITFLSLGVSGLQQLLEQRKDVAAYLRDGIQTLAEKHGERLLVSKGNNISFAMTVDRVTSSQDAPVERDGKAYGDKRATTFLGSMLFTRNVSGARAVHPQEVKIIDGYTFESYGASYTGYPHAYITAAAAMGMTRGDVDVYLNRLEKCLKDMQKSAKDKATPPPA